MTYKGKGLEGLNPSSKVWIYQSDRELTNLEIEKINSTLVDFVGEWNAHGASLKAGFDILHNYFIVLCVDESQAMASGCSIDSSVRVIKQIEKEISVNFFDRLKMAFKAGESVKVVNRDVFEDLYYQGIISNETIVFNNLVATKAEFENKWQVPLTESWHKQLIGA